MLGNDIVDLVLARTQSNWRRKNYLSKIFTAEEQVMILQAENPDVMVWLLWSMKESAYKIHNRKTGIRNFAPQSLACVISSALDLSHGAVRIDDEQYFTKSHIQSAYLHTMASADQQHVPNIKAAVYEYPNNNFDYKRTSPGCVSHHGRYLALVY